MTGAFSLRARLTAIILTPLIAIAVAVGLWAVSDAQERAIDRFNRDLLSAALAISRDVAISGGDLLSARTDTVLRDTSGGRVFYHVYAPDGVFVTGFATPPIPVTATDNQEEGPQYFEGVHQSRSVLAIRFVDTMSVDGFSGDFTVTVWQDRVLRNDLMRELVQATILVIALLVTSLALIVWFGVRFGLRPLNDLEDAIAQRTSDELSTIQRDVPNEVNGIVRTLNRLFQQLRNSMAAQNDFISNAAHQLRNPIAGVLSLAEAVASAPDGKATKERSQDLLEAARAASDLSQKLLLLERAKSASPVSTHEVFDLSHAVGDWVEELRGTLPDRVTLESDVAEDLQYHGDRTMLREALRNLVDNSVRHGGEGLTSVRVRCAVSGGQVSLSVEDDGRGIPEAEIAHARERFRQISPTSSSGLGVSIVESVAMHHNGHLLLSGRDPGLRAELVLGR